MILFNPSPLIPKPLRRTYAILRILMFMIILSASISFTKSFLFPSQSFSYSFQSQAALKNTLDDPISTAGEPVKKGVIAGDTKILTYAGTFGHFTSANIRLTFAKGSDIPASVTLTARKSFRSFFLPEGDPIREIPKDRAFTAPGAYYYWNNENLIPFVSKAAAFSRFDGQSILPASDDFLRVFPPGNGTAGFRVGSLLSNADGVFAVTSDQEIRPIGSTDIFNALGFAWNDVIPVSEEELRLYRRGRIMLFDAQQPDGTLFHDRDTDALSIIQGGLKHRIENDAYRSAIAKRSTPIETSSVGADIATTCTITKDSRNGILPLFSAEYSCVIPLDALGSSAGENYEIALTSSGNIRLASMDAEFMTEIGRDNLSIVLRQIRDRFIARYTKQP